MKVSISLCAIVALSVASPQSSINYQLLPNGNLHKYVAVNRNSSRRNYNSISQSQQQEQSKIVGPYNFAHSYNSSEDDFQNFSFSNEQVQSFSFKAKNPNQYTFINENIPENVKDINEPYNNAYNSINRYPNPVQYPQEPSNSYIDFYINSRHGHKKPSPTSNQKNGNGVNKSKNIAEKITLQNTKQQIKETVIGDNEPANVAFNTNTRQRKYNPSAFYNQWIDNTVSGVNEPYNAAYNINTRQEKYNPNTFYNQQIDDAVKGTNAPYNFAYNVNKPQSRNPSGQLPISYIEKLKRTGESKNDSLNSRSGDPNSFTNQQIHESVNGVNEPYNDAYNINTRQKKYNPSTFYNHRTDNTVSGVNELYNAAYNINTRQEKYSPSTFYNQRIDNTVSGVNEPYNDAYTINTRQEKYNPSTFYNQRIDDTVNGVNEPYNAAYNIKTRQKKYNPSTFYNQRIEDTVNDINAPYNYAYNINKPQLINPYNVNHVLGTSQYRH